MILLPDIWISLLLYACTVWSHGYGFGWFPVKHHPNQQIPNAFIQPPKVPSQPKILYQFWRKKKMLKGSVDLSGYKPHLKRFFHYSPFIRYESENGPTDRARKPKKEIKNEIVNDLAFRAVISSSTTTTKAPQVMWDVTASSAIKFPGLADKGFEKPWTSEINTFDRRRYRIPGNVPTKSESIPTKVSLPLTEVLKPDHATLVDHSLQRNTEGPNVQYLNNNIARDPGIINIVIDDKNKSFEENSSADVTRNGGERETLLRESKNYAHRETDILSLLRDISSMVERLASNYQQKSDEIKPIITSNENAVQNIRNKSKTYENDQLVNRMTANYPISDIPEGIVSPADVGFAANKYEGQGDTSLPPPSTPIQIPEMKQEVLDPSLFGPPTDSFSSFAERNPVLEKHAENKLVGKSPLEAPNTLQDTFELPPLREQLDYQDYLITDPKFPDNEQINYGYFLPNYDSYSGFFDYDQSGCDGIESRTCVYKSECSCYGLYFCIKGKCTMLPAIPNEDESPLLDGTWLDLPVKRP